MAEAMGDHQPPVPVVVGVGLGVGGHQHHRGVDVAALVEDPQVELEIGPVVGQRGDEVFEPCASDDIRRETYAEQRW